MAVTRGAWFNGFLGIAIFAGSLPATRLAVTGFAPVFLTCARACIAALLGALLLGARWQRWPTAAEWRGLLSVALGVVVGFPLLTALALRSLPAAQATVFVGLLPLCTAVFGVLRGDERPRPLFWLFSLGGAAAVVGYAVRDGLAAVGTAAPLQMLGAVLVCGWGYAEGARLTPGLGGWRVISFALLLALPLTLPIAGLLAPASLQQIGLGAWLGLAYVSLFSMLLGFVFWYRGLALGGIAAVSQLQLLQPFMALALAALLLHESLDASMLAASALAALCVLGARRHAR